MKISRYSYKDYGFEGALYDTEDPNDDRLLIVIQGLKGLSLPEKYASLFSSKGISSLAFAYYGVPGLPQKMRAIPLETFENAATYFKSNARFRRFGIYGNSKGAGVALLAASVVPDISLVIAASTFGHIMQGTGKPSENPCKAMVSYKGQDFPYVPAGHIFRDFIRRCIKEKKVRTLYFFEEWDKKGTEQNEIPVEKINGDILFLTSTHDESVPSKKDVELLTARLKRENFKHKFRHVNSETGSHNLGYFPVNNNLLPREKKYPKECQNAREEALQIILQTVNGWGV